MYRINGDLIEKLKKRDVWPSNHGAIYKTHKEAEEVLIKGLMHEREQLEDAMLIVSTRLIELCPSTPKHTVGVKK